MCEDSERSKCHKLFRFAQKYPIKYLKLLGHLRSLTATCESFWGFNIVTMVQVYKQLRGEGIDSRNPR